MNCRVPRGWHWWGIQLELPASSQDAVIDEVIGQVEGAEIHLNHAQIIELEIFADARDAGTGALDNEAPVDE